MSFKALVFLMHINISSEPSAKMASHKRIYLNLQHSKYLSIKRKLNSKMLKEKNLINHHLLLIEIEKEVFRQLIGINQTYCHLKEMLKNRL